MIIDDRIHLPNGQPVPFDGSRQGLKANIDTWIAASAQHAVFGPRFNARTRHDQPAEGAQKRRLSTPPSSIEEDTGHSPKKRRHLINVVDSESDEDEVGTAVRPNAPCQAPWMHVPGRRVRERRGGIRRVPVSRTTWNNVQVAQPNELPDEDMKGTTPPRTPPGDVCTEIKVSSHPTRCDSCSAGA